MNTSICDYYTTGAYMAPPFLKARYIDIFLALLQNNTAANQATVLTLVVNTAVIGNYTKPTIPDVTFPDVAVNGILNNGTYNGTAVNLLPYFDGGLASSNRGGSSGVAVNFLDDGGAAPLMMNMPSNGNSSVQYQLLTHLYQFFGTLLGCSQQGMPGFSSFEGHASMYNVHKFMDLDPFEVGYFIEQVGLSASSFGVADDDVTAVGMALTKLFDYRCAPATTVIPASGPLLQSICIADTCPISPNATCSAYDSAMEPGVANATLAMGEGNSSSTATASFSMSSASATGSATASGSGPAISTAAAAGNKAGGVLAVGGLLGAAFLL
ncbi:hypothetical protein MMC10_007362 [Thelotrema lepadinum]|nr:hypothetical protein [Thelotrema lepadinum]